MSVVQQGLSVGKALAIAGLPRSSYYYRSNGRPKGKKASTHTVHCNGMSITNERLVELIKELLAREFIDYGYKRTAHQLKRDGWVVNIKKVYRLMREHGLLYPARKRSLKDKNYAEHTKPRALYPFHIIEVDIKYIWLSWQRRHAYLVTFLCVKTRFAIRWELGLTMKSRQVTRLLEQVVTDPLVAELAGSDEHQLWIRTDNGPQFIARKLAEACQQTGLYHEFIQPGTPQQNGHIEGFHSTVERIICQQYELRYLQDALQVFNRFYQTYNYHRIMAAVGYKTPYEALREWACSNGKTLPAEEEAICLQTIFNQTSTLTNQQSDLSSL
jgi:transposase InsO family protein